MHHLNYYYQENKDERPWWAYIAHQRTPANVIQRLTKIQVRSVIKSVFYKNLHFTSVNVRHTFLQCLL